MAVFPVDRSNADSTLGCRALIAEIVKALSESREPLLITRNGEAKLVVIDVKSYEEQAETLALVKILALGNKEIEAGRFRPAQDVLAELNGKEAQ